jgi:hypothetical protein
LWLGAILGSIVLSWALAATTHAETTGPADPNDYQCQGHVTAGTAELGSEEAQVQYTFACNGPITGYQLETNIPVTGFESSPALTNLAGEPLSDTFSCGGEVPGFADNCVGSTKAEYETITGQFAIGTKVCAEPRVDPLLTVTDIYLEKGVPTQAISGPFDLGRPHGCPATAYKGGTRLEPKTQTSSKGKSKGKSGKGKAGKHKKATKNSKGKPKKK